MRPSTATFVPSPAHRPRARGHARAKAKSRGSLLLVAMVIAVVIGVSLGTYLKLAMGSARLADRSFYQSAAVNLAEIGVEEALYCFNRLDNVSTAANAWSGTGVTWTLSGGAATATIGPVNLGTNINGSVKVYCDHYDTSVTSPIVVARAIITMPQGQTIEKWLKITLRKRSLFSNGLVARDSVTWSGHPSADSWNSDPDNDGAGIVAYAAGVRTANVTIGAVNGSIDLASGGDVYGYARSGGGTISGGSVHGTGTTTNDPSRYSYDFSASFPSVSVPTPATSYLLSGSVPATLPRTTDSANASDGKYYYNIASGTAITGNLTIGTSVPNKSVVLMLTAHGGVDVIKFSGHDSLTITNGSTLTIYTNGDIRNTGDGVINASTTSPQQPEKLIIYGTATTAGGQSFDVGGNGKFSGAIYAPNANVKLHGGGSSGEILGSIIANQITMNGHPDFHYDEHLGTLGGGNPFGVQQWEELQSSSQRATYASLLNF